MSSDYAIGQESDIDFYFNPAQGNGLDGETSDALGDEYSIYDFLGQQNIAGMLDEEMRTKIAGECVQGYKIDEANFQSRRDRIEDLYKLALQAIEQKNYPFENSANVKYPVLTSAAIGFASLAYPAIIDGESVVKGKPVGNDDGDKEIIGANKEPLRDKDTGEVLRTNAGEKQRRADRVAKFQSHQILQDMDGWADDMDKILHILPIVGSAFKKTYHDPILRKNVSRLVLPQFLILNIDAANVESANRASEVFNLYPHEIQEGINAGIFIDFEYTQSGETQQDSYQDSDPEENAVSGEDASLPHAFIEQHCRYDVDGDGYPEPYVAVIHKETEKLVRLFPRFQPEDVEASDDGEIIRIQSECFYEDFYFFPDPEGSPYGIGFGHLVQHLNIAANTGINQILDQGHLYTLNGGFIGSNMRIKSGNLKFRPNEWKRVRTGGQNLRDNIVPMPVREPSAVLMALLEFLIKAAEQVTSVSRVLSGDLPANMPVGTALAIIEQAIQPFKAVYKRVHRSLGKEYKRLYKLNQLYLTQEEYQRVLDDQEADIERDMQSGDADIVPVSDPEIITNVQKIFRGQVLMEQKDDPMMDPVKTRIEALKSMGIKDAEEYVKLPETTPDPVAVAQQAALEAQINDLQSQITARERDQQRKDKELAVKIETAFADIKKKEADAVLAVARAEGEEAGTQLDMYKTQLDTLDKLKQELTSGNDEGRMGEMEGPSDNS